MPQQTSPRRAFFNLPKRTIAPPAVRISRDPSATVRVDVRGRLITLGPGPNSRVTNANVYEDRWRYPYPAGRPRVQLRRPTNTAVVRRAPGTPLYRPIVALTVRVVLFIHYFLSLTRSVEKVG